MAPGNSGFSPSYMLSTLIPQGWNFFTRDPQEARYWIFRNDDSLTPVDPVDARGNGLFSFTSRAWRVRGMELARLTSGVPATKWSECNDTIVGCARSAHATPVRLVNSMAVKSLCGTFTIVHHTLTPWAWYARSAEQRARGSVARIEVSC